MELIANDNIVLIISAVMLLVAVIMLTVTASMRKTARETQDFITKENKKKELNSFRYDIISSFWDILLTCRSLNEKEMAHNINYRKFVSNIDYYSIIFHKDKDFYKHIMFLFKCFHNFDWPKMSVNKKNKLEETIKFLNNIFDHRLMNLCHPKHQQTIIITHNKTK